MLAAVSCGERQKVDRAEVLRRDSPHITAFDSLSSLTVGNGGFAVTVDATGLQTFPEIYQAGIPLGTMSDWGLNSNLGRIGFVFPDSVTSDSLLDVDQNLNLALGYVSSEFTLRGDRVSVLSACHPSRDLFSASVSAEKVIPVKFEFPHYVRIISSQEGVVILKQRYDGYEYYIKVGWNGGASFERADDFSYVLVPDTADFSFSCEFCPQDRIAEHAGIPSFSDVFDACSRHWYAYWQKGGMIDCSHCTDPRAAELERRVVLSQYLLAVQAAGDVPPQETGLTCTSPDTDTNLEMEWWHQAQFALWGHPEILAHTMEWYADANVDASETATDSYPVWQLPMYIYLADLMYRADKSEQTLNRYWDLVEKTADFMASYVDYDSIQDSYSLPIAVPMQESVSLYDCTGPTFELSAWRYGLATAQKWRGRMDLGKLPAWQDVIDGMPGPATDADGLVLAAWNLKQSYTDAVCLSGHPSVLGAYGMFPKSKMFRDADMAATFDRIWNDWKWKTASGQDFPMAAMCAARIGRPDLAVEALLRDEPSNIWLAGGQNWQGASASFSLAGNGALLSAVAMMCAGWDGSAGRNPGFPDDGWDIVWDGIKPLP